MSPLSWPLPATRITTATPEPTIPHSCYFQEQPSQEFQHWALCTFFIVGYTLYLISFSFSWQTLFCNLTGRSNDKLFSPKFCSTPKPDRNKYCICKKPYNEESELSMLMCDNCNNWFHAICVKVELANMKHRGFTCPDCAGNNWIFFPQGWSYHESGTLTLQFPFLFARSHLRFVLARTVGSHEISSILATSAHVLSTPATGMTYLPITTNQFHLYTYCYLKCCCL